MRIQVTSTFDFLMVLYSIIIGISLSKILSAVGNIIQGNKPVKLYWVHSGWVVFVFFLHIFLWFSAWQYAAIQVWSIASFMTFLTIPVILFVLSVITLPDIDPDRNYDMRDYYYRNYRWLNTMLIAIVVLTATNEYLLLDQHPFNLDNAARAAVTLVLLAASFSAKPKIHGFEITILFLLMGSFALTYRESIGG